MQRYNPQCQHYVPSEREMRAAIAARDASFDHHFFYGVVTTGVFCLPSCAARPARPENLRFYHTSSAALAAGMRECKRCQPLQSEQRDMKVIDTAHYIAAHSAERLGLETLAARVDLSSSRLRKRFTELLGVSPKAFHDQQRIKCLKSSLSAGERVTEAMHNAGYGSTSRLYSRAAEQFGMTPSTYRNGGAGELIYYASTQTRIGWLLLAATSRGVCFAQPGDNEAGLLTQLAQEFPKATLRASSAGDSAQLARWMEGLNDHLSQNAPRPDIPLDLQGTAFQVQVWKYLLSIPQGTVVSYADVARGCGKPKAVRAAASACGQNRIAVLIPCHRVLRGDGGIGGYRWGVARKRALLAGERQGVNATD